MTPTAPDREHLPQHFARNGRFGILHAFIILIDQGIDIGVDIGVKLFNSREDARRREWYGVGGWLG
jgi:hypothetical protein